MNLLFKSFEFRRSISGRALPFAFCVLFSGTALYSAPSLAQVIEKLDRNNIKSFIETATLMSQGGASDMSQEDVLAYLRDHIHDDARFVTSMTFKMPGMPPQETQMTIQKPEFIQGVQEADKAVNGYENEVDIKKIKIAVNKKSATVQTVGKEEGEMPMQLESGDVQYVPIEGVSECTQTLGLSNAGLIQMMDAKCKTTIEFKDF